MNRRAALLTAALAALPMTATARVETPAHAEIIEAWRVADCSVIAAAVARVEPGLFWKRQAMTYKETIDGDATRPLYELIKPVVPGRYGVTSCPEIATPVAVDDNALFDRPFWSADHSKVLLKIQLKPLSSPANLDDARGRWRFFLLERDGAGWRVLQTQDVASSFWPTTVDEIT